MKQSLGLLSLVALVLFSAQTIIRDRVELGPAASTVPTTGNGALTSLTVGSIDAGAVLITGALNQVTSSFNLGNGCLTLTGGVTTLSCAPALPTNQNFTSGANSILQWNQGFISMGVGSFGTPQVYFSGDTDTGFYWPAANQIGFTVGATAQFVMRGSGLLSSPALNSNLTMTETGSSLGTGSSTIAVVSAQVTTNSTGGMDIATANAPLKFGGVPVLVSTTPTVSSGFGTSPSVTAGKAYAFRVNVGTGGVATSGVINLATTATTGWNCTCADITTQSTTVFLCKQTAGSTTTATITNYNTAGAAAAWVASDILAVSCVAF